MGVCAGGAWAAPSAPAQGGKKVVISSGHLDIGPKMVKGQWQAALRDDTVNPPVWRSLEDVVVHVTDEAKTPVPADDKYSFLNLQTGATPWVIPQTQNPNVVWVGYNTQDPEAVNVMGRGADLSLEKISGPADVNLFLQDGGFEPPRVLWQSENGPDQSIWMEVNSHVHMNWVFPEAGEYVLKIGMTAQAGDPAPSAGGSLKVVVGSGTPVSGSSAPATVSGLPPTTASSEVVAEPEAVGKTDRTSYIILGVITALLAAGGGFAFVQQRRARAASQAHLKGPA